MQGQEPIGWADLDAFIRRSGVRLTADEVELLEVIDDAYLTSFSADPSAGEQKLALRDSLERVSKPRER